MTFTPDSTTITADPSSSLEVPPSDPLRGIRVALAIIAILMVVAAITYLGRILEQVLIALFLYYAISPIPRALARHGVPVWVSYLFLLIAVAVVSLLLGRMLHANTMHFLDRLPTYQAKMETTVEKLDQWLQGDKEDAQNVGKMLTEATNTVIRSAVTTALGGLEAGLMIFVYLLFMILNSEKITHRIRKAFTEKQAARVLLIAHKINEGMQQYMKTKTLVSLGLGVSSTLLMACFGLDYYLLWGFLFFALNYITYVGSIAACVPPMALAFLEFDNVILAVLLGLLIVANRLFWIDFVEIKLSGQSLNLDPLLLLLSLAFWGWFWGLVGLVLAVPMLTSLKIVLANIEETRHWAILISEE